MFKSFIEYANNLNGTNESIVTEGKGWAKLMKAVRAGSKSGPWTIVSFEGRPSKIVNQELIQYMDLIPAHYEEVKKRFPNAKMSIEDNTGMSVYNESVVTEKLDEVFIGPFVFNDTMSDEELKAMYDGALDGYANWQKGFQHPKAKYKQAYQEIEKLLKKRGVTVDESKYNGKVTEGETLKKGDIVKFKDGRSIYIVGPKGDGYDYKDGQELGHHPKGWFDMMISTGKAVIESVNEGKVLLADLPQKLHESTLSSDELGEFYTKAINFVDKFKRGGNQKLRDVIGEDLFFNRGKEWFFNAWNVKKLTSSEVSALLKKLETNESVVTEAKDDYVARYSGTNITLKKAYKHLNDEELNQLYLEIGELIADNKLKVKDATFTFESATNEAFYRMSSDTVGNELYAASQALTTYYDRLQAGNDSGEGKSLDHIIDLLKKCKTNIKKFNKAEEVKGTVYESIVTEGRSINKIQKDWTNVTAMMKDAVADWKSAEGKDKEDLLDQLKVLTISKKKIEAELEDAVGLKDMDVELAESVISILNEGVNELNERTITLKRRYTENHPALTAGKTARIRNKMLEAIADGKLTEEEFNTVLSEMSPDSSRWIRRNARFFNVSEDGITLSKYGMKAYRQTKINESELSEARGSWIVYTGDGEKKFYSEHTSEKSAKKMVDMIIKKFDNVNMMPKESWEKEITEAFVIENFEAFESTVAEIKTSMISGNSGRTISSLEDRKYELTKDVKGARIGDFVNVILPKGTIIYNLPGGVFANHPSLKDTYTSKYGNGPKWVSQSWGEGVSVRQEPETLEAIEKNSKVL